MASFPADISTGWWKSFVADPFSAGDRIYTDIASERKALELRVQGKRASWVSRYKGMTTLGYAAVAEGITEIKMLTPQDARYLNEVVRGLKDRDPELVKPFLVSFYTVLDKHHRRDAHLALKAAEETLARARGQREHENAWTLQQCLDAFVQQRRSDQKHVLDPMKMTSIKEVETTFKKPAFAEVLGKPVTTLTRAKAEEIRNAIDKKHGPSPGIKAVSNLRSVLDHALEYNAACGLDERNPWWRLLKPIKKIGSREVTLTTEGLGKTLALVEYFLDHRLPNRTGVQHGVRENTFSAFLWLVLTGHRQTSGLSLEVSSYKPWKDHDGWFVAEWSGDVMKNGEAFSLPIPPKVVAVIQSAREKADHFKESKWAFPSEDGPDVRATRSGTLSILKRLSARDDFSRNKLTERQRLDLLELNEIPYWTPHMVRNVVATFMDLVGMPGAASAILAHTISGEKDNMTKAQREAWAKQNVAEVTKRYHAMQHLKLKSEAMLIWTDAVLESWEQARNEPLFVDRDKTVILSELKKEKAAA